jgi:hypothetical protein
VVSNHLSTVFGDGSGLAPQAQGWYEMLNGATRQNDFLQAVNRTGELNNAG